MIKIASPALRHPQNRSLDDFHNYWGESHGPLFSQTKTLRRYVQHLTLHDAYGGNPAPTWDGLSMFWFDTPEAFVVDSSSPREVQALREEVGKDDRQLFDRIQEWPLDHKRASVAATERVVVEGETTPEMVKALFVVARKPGLSHPEFFEHWFEVHGALAAKLPGLRRYVQNHAVLEALASRPMTHDGFSELWFDDLESLQAAARSPEWRAMKEDSATLFADPIGCVIAREKIQKEIDVPLKEPDALHMSEDEIRARLEEQGFRSLAADTNAPARIKAAAQAGLLAVWTREHLVTIDEARIDARPER
jgi:uncharacterized protein (TIGR02118 family)